MKTGWPSHLVCLECRNTYTSGGRTACPHCEAEPTEISPLPVYRVHWILEGREPVPVADLLEWGRWFQDVEDRRVALTHVGGIRISTVFLGLDHGFGEEGPPILFETMTFGWPMNDECWRYATWDEAVAGHRRAVRLARWNLTVPGLIVLGLNRAWEWVRWRFFRWRRAQRG